MSFDVKATLWTLGSLLALDLLFLCCFCLIRTDYENALTATFYAIIFGVTVLAAFIYILVLHLNDP